MSQIIFHRLPVERPVQLWLDGRLCTTFYCTPADLPELVLGYLMGRGLLDPARLPRIRTEEAPLRVAVETADPLGKSVPRRETAAPWTTTLAEVVRQAEDTMENTPLRQSSGGVHGASVRWPGGMVVREDIARHNAVDKAIGAGIMKEINFARSALFTTGRLSHEMVAKAAAVGIPVVATMKYPSDLGVELAAQKGICVIGRVLSSSPEVYTGEWRLGLKLDNR